MKHLYTLKNSLNESKSQELNTGGGIDKNNDNIIITNKKLHLIHYTDNDKPIISNNEDRLIPNSLSASNSTGWSHWGKNKFEIVLPKDIKILQINNENFWNYGKEIDTPKNRGKAIYKEAKNKNVDVIFLNKIAGQPKEYCILNNNFIFKKLIDGGYMAHGGDIDEDYTKEDQFYCYTTGYDGMKNKYGNEDNLDLEEAVNFAHRFDIVSEKYSEEELEEIIKNIPKGKEQVIASSANLMGVVVRKKQSDSYAYGGHLEAHGLKLGDKIIKTIGSYQKVQNKEGNIVYVDLATGYRNTKEPMPFNNGGKVEKASSEPRIMIMNKYIDKFGTHYGVNLYLLNVKINKSNEEQVQKYIDEGLSPFDIYEKLKNNK
jgi:hypothetical protein